jgi:NAD(P)-dependent dehydrogenase (short-subunit alcohol dehydrogenase family)
VTIDLNFAGKRVLVTGADQPIGAAAVQAFRDDGALVVAHNSVVDGALDSAEGCKALVETAVATLGGLDILINASDYREDKPFEQVSPEDWDKALDGSFTASLFCTQYALPALQASKGNIVNITSSYGQMGGADGSSAYTAAAASIVNMTRMQALRFGVDGVRSNCLCAGPLEGATATQEAELPPIGRNGTAQDMVGSILLIASDHASFMTGAIIVVDGGRYSGA